MFIFTNLDLFCIDNARVIYRKIRYIELINNGMTSLKKIHSNTDDEISPSLHSRTDLVNTDTLSDENMMMAGTGRNM
jgi:hypothetical protein